VPLRDGASRVGEHVAPVTQLGPGRVAAEHDATDRVRRPDPVVVDDRHHQLDFLHTHTHTHTVGKTLLTKTQSLNEQDFFIRAMYKHSH